MEITAHSNLGDNVHRYSPRCWFFTSMRGFCILLLIFYFLLIPVRFEYDIVATVIVSCFGALIVILGLGVFFLGLHNHKNLVISSGIPATLPVFSQIETTLCFTVSSLLLLPFFRVSYVIEFESDDLAPLSISLSGTGNASQTKIYVPVTFPHRGNWRFKKVTWTVRDEFDLWYFRKSDTVEGIHSIIPVIPAQGFDSQPPIISSCLRDGDSVSDIQEPRGDYYDLKKYHPADGMRKIVWKIFARSGELLSRHPEKTMTPEGKVLMFVCARSPHDGAARVAVNYCRQICDAGLECNTITLGYKHHGPAKNPDELETMLVETAWSSNENTVDDINDLLDLLTEETTGSGESIITQIIVVGDFISAYDDYDQLIQTVGNRILERDLTPVFLLAMPHPHIQEKATKPSVFSTLTKLFIEKEKQISHVPNPEQFFNTAASHRWEIYRIFE